MSTVKKAVAYFDLTRQHTLLAPQIEKAVQNVITSGRYILSPVVQNFEKKFSRYCGTRLALGVGSGTDALIFALKALGIGPGQEVIVPSFTFSATVFAILHVGATPKFVEVDEATYTLDPRAVDAAVTKKTVCILPVHLYGQTADMPAILKITGKKKLHVVEDACQAHGAAFQNQKAGSFGTLGCFSFYPTKNLGAMGDGGMVTTNHSHFAEQIRRFRNLGRVAWNKPHRVLGWTSRLDSLQAAILDIKLNYLERWNEKRRRLASLYKERLASTPLVLPQEAEGRRHIYHLFVVRVPDKRRNALRERLLLKGVASMIHYPIPAHLQPGIKRLGKTKVRLRITEKISREILSLPMFPEMRENEVDYVCGVIKSFFR